MIVLSVATHEERMFKIFKESCARNNVELRVLGFGQKWKGFAWRWELILEALEGVDDKEIVLVTDAFDTLILQTEKEITSRFLEFQTEIVFGAHRVSKNIFVKYYCMKTFGCNTDVCLNGGTYIGYAGAIKNLIQDLEFEPSSDDQRVINLYHNRVKALDYDIDHKLFYFATHFDPARIDDGGVPDSCLISFPGRVVLYKSIQNMGYRYEPGDHGNMPLRRHLFFLFFTDYIRFVLLEISIVVFLIILVVMLIVWRRRRRRIRLVNSGNV